MVTEITSIFDEQRKAYLSGINRTFEERKQNLINLKRMIVENEDIILEALKDDLGKGSFEGVVGETTFTVKEIDHTLKKLKKYMKPKKMWGPILQFPSSSQVVPEPLGNILIISPWNYPFQLLISPLVGALAAGNVAILKPSEVAENTSRTVALLIPRYFNRDVVSVVEGAVEETQALLSLPFNHIFYTGNGAVGRIVMEKAAKHLCPVTLELGGKSPCLILGNNDFDLVAKRLVWAKFFNAGQTCVAPDYVLVEKESFGPLVEKLEKYIRAFYGVDPKKSADFGRIINQRHLNRLKTYLVSEETILGGDFDDENCYLSPTILKADTNSPAMKEEIFGPILPILIVASFDEALEHVRRHSDPLAAYLFTKDKKVKKRFIEDVASGGQCINDSIVHLTDPHLPFGGRGQSGMGSYHGQRSFEIFSHMKSVMSRGLIDLPLRYPPYKGKLGLIRWLLSWFG